jgi:hypothetical protein
MDKDILVITSSPGRYQYNTNMWDVINDLRQREPIAFLDIPDFTTLMRPIERIKAEINRKNVKTVLFIDGPPILIINLEELQELRKSVRIGMFFGDIFAHFHSCYKYFAQVVDIALVDEDVEVGNFRKYVPNVIFVPYSYNVPDEAVASDTYEYEISFIGRTDRRNRGEYLRTLAKYHQVSCFGVGSANGPVTDGEMRKIFASSKINLNFTGVQDERPYVHAQKIDTILRSPKGRCQQIGMQGGFVLSEYAPGLENLFDLQTELPVFYNERDMLEKANFYKNNHDIRLEISHNLMQKCRNEYAIDQVWSEVIQKINVSTNPAFENTINRDYNLTTSESRIFARQIKILLTSEPLNKSAPKIFSLIKKIGFMKSLNFTIKYIRYRK